MNKRVLVLYPPSNAILRAGLAIPVLYTYLRSKGIDVYVLDCPGKKISNEELKKEIEKIKPDIIGVSIGATEHLHDAIIALENIRNNFPDKLLVCGGIHVTLMPEDVIQHCDITCIGYGQETLEEIVNLYPALDAIKKIKGIAYLKDGKHVFNEERNTDMKNLPPIDWSCIPIENYFFEIIYDDPSTKSIPTFLTMGCPNRCSFCASKRLYKGKIKFRNIDFVLDEIEMNKNKYGVNNFYFYDPCFTVNAKFAKEFCKKLIERKLNIKWLANCTLNTITDELIEIMAKAGCCTLGFGVESCSDYILKKINKSYQNFEKMKHVLDECKKNNLFTPIGIIIGFIDDTIDTVFETITKSAELNIDSLGVSLLTPYPGSDDYFRAQTEGRFLCKDFSKLNCFSVNYIPQGLLDYDIWKCRCFTFYYFYSRNYQRFSYWMRRLKKYPEYNNIVQGWTEIYENRDKLDHDYFIDYVILDTSKRKKKNRKFYEPFLPDFSKAHTTDYFKIHKENQM